MTPSSSSATSTQHLRVEGGEIGFDVAGKGPLLLLVPGMGELRSSYRHLAPLLVAAGYRVATADLRGHGDSSAGFDAYGDVPTASDIAALIRHLGAPAVIVGNSMAAGAAVIVAAEHPELVSGLVLVGPFVRTPPNQSAMAALMFRMLMARPWAVAAWNAYLPTLYSGQKPADFEAYRATMIRALRRPGYARAFRLTTRTDHLDAERSLARVTAPALVVMGDADPDFADPAAEATWIAETLHGTAVMVEDAGHYPQSQRPERTADAILAFLREGVDRA
ncbi:alpha/beta fold hydrolase [Microbacterium sp. Clip185]|uniref:alpha/beta fold hydrolase n=1 Tax=Microbacterium sp. Clip185 TaxID=3025663 RepID=UPI0023653379|nr:alpha/beta hydrolase [Microbacterium sp. Clip185]WDG18448.1 alpha/beta hydrolase [Microbacterium sp. Clip185]